MRQGSNSSELFVICSEQIVLNCTCGGRLILLGLEEDWYSEGRTVFMCRSCGRQLTLVDRSDRVQGPPLIGSADEAMGVRDLIRSLRADSNSRH